jgi:hypothetical protein
MTEHDDDFFERLRAGARPLRYQPDEIALSRIRAHIHETIERPTVAEMLAAWFRPVLATVAALAAAAVVTLTAIDSGEQAAYGEDNVEIVMGDESYRVGN